MPNEVIASHILTIDEALGELHLDADTDGIVDAMLSVLDAEIIDATGVDWRTANDDIGLNLAKGVERKKLRIEYFGLTDQMLLSQTTAKVKQLQARALSIKDV